MAGLTARLVQELPPDRLADFYTWIEGMTLDQDREDGADFAAWLRAHARTPGDCVWAFYNAAGDLLGAASLVKQDRELLAPPGGWVIAGVNVVRQRRGQGFGRAIMAWLENELDRRALERTSPVHACLQAEYPVAVQLYTSLGFIPHPEKKGVFEKIYLTRNL